MAHRAFIVGVNTQGLKFCETDAALIDYALKLYHYYTVTFKTPERKTTILEAFESFIDGCSKTDTVVFYFSGHGLLNRGRLNLLLAQDANKVASRLSLSVVTESFEACLARKKLIILDCCYAGSGLTSWTPTPSDHFRWLIASNRIEENKELDNLKASFLAHRLHLAFTQPPAEILDDSRNIRLNALHKWLEKEADQYNNSHPTIIVPRPDLVGSASSDLELATIIHLPDSITPSVKTPQLLQEEAAEARYRELALKSYDIIDLTNLPVEERHLATRGLELRQLYVPLRIIPEVSAEVEVTQDNLKILEDRHKAHLWERQKPKQDRSDDLLSVGGALKRSSRLVILGDPGAGKTTLLRWLATSYLLRLDNAPEWQALPDVDKLPTYNWLPILVRCRDLDSNTTYLDDILLQVLRKLQLPTDQVDLMLEVLRNKLMDGRAFLLIDGLDEIIDPAARVRFCREIEQIQTAYQKAPILVTSRIVGYREMGFRIGRGFEHTTVADLSKEDKESFAHRWCELTEPPEQQEAAAADLIRDIHSTDRIDRLTNNPMLLTTLALVKRKVRRLPTGRAELYREAVQVLLNWRSDWGPPLDYREALPQLRYLAFFMCNQGVQQLREDEILNLLHQMRHEYPNIYPISKHNPDEFLRLLEQRTGIIIESGQEPYRGGLAPVFEFRHLTFQEYLAAQALVHRTIPNPNRKLSLAETVAPLAGRIRPVETDVEETEYVVTENWRETLRLCVATCGNDEVDAVIQAILKPLPEEDATQTTHPRAVQATLCLADEPNVSQETAKAVLKSFVDDYFKGDSFDFEISSSVKNAAEEVAESRWGNLLHTYLINMFCRPDATLSNLVAGELSGKVSSNSVSKDQIEFHQWVTQQIDCLRTDESFRKIRTTLSIFSLFESENSYWPLRLTSQLFKMLKSNNIGEARVAGFAFVNWSQKTTKRDVWRPSTSELKNLEALLNNDDTDPWVFGLVLIILVNEYASLSKNMLITHLNTKNKLVCLFATAAIDDKRNILPVELLLPNLTHTDKTIRIATINALSRLKDKKAVEPLIKGLTANDKEIRLDTIDALGQLRDDRAIESLLTCLHDSDKAIRQATVKVLRKFDDFDVVEPLLTCLADEEYSVRRAAISALGELGDVRVVEPLLTCLADEEYSVRRAAISALGELGDVRAVEPLLTCLADEEYSVRRAAISALGELGDVRAVEPLLTCLADEDESVRRAAISALGELGDVRAIVPIATVLEDQDYRVYPEAIHTLGKIDDIEVTETILSLREFSLYGWNNILDKLGDAQVSRVLLTRLKDADPAVRKRGALALGRLGDVQVVGSLLACLTDDDDAVRQIAAEALGQLGDVQAVEPLLNCLTDTESNVRQAAAESLGRLGDARAVDPLLATLSDTNDEVRLSVIASLGLLGDAQAIEPLIAYLKNKDNQILYKAIVFALGKLGDNSVVDLILSLVSNADNDLQQTIFFTLGKLGDNSVVDTLLAYLSDADDVVQRSIIEALGMLGDTRAIEPLAVYLENDDLAWQAAEALGQLGDIRAIDFFLAKFEAKNSQTPPSLKRALANLKNLPLVERLLTCLQSQNFLVRESAVETLGDLVQDKVLIKDQVNQMFESLLPLLEDEWNNVRQAAIKTLGKLGDVRAVEPLLARLEDPDNAVRCNTIEALGKLGHRRVVKTIITHLTDANIEVRQAAAEALGRLGDTQATQPLLTYLDDEDEDIHPIAIQALGQLKDEEAIRIVRSKLLDKHDEIRKAALGGLAKAHVSEVDFELLTRDIDGIAPYLDPKDRITEFRVRRVARTLELLESDVQQRYETLAEQFGLNLSWQQSLKPEMNE